VKLNNPLYFNESITITYVTT